MPVVVGRIVKIPMRRGQSFEGESFWSEKNVVWVRTRIANKLPQEVTRFADEQAALGFIAIYSKDMNIPSSEFFIKEVRK